MVTISHTAPSLVGPWVSLDGRMRVNLHVDGRFDETRVGSARTFHGIYSVDGARIHFRDSTTGYEAIGEVRDDGFVADGVAFRRE